MLPRLLLLLVFFSSLAEGHFDVEDVLPKSAIQKIIFKVRVALRIRTLLLVYTFPFYPWSRNSHQKHYKRLQKDPHFKSFNLTASHDRKPIDLSYKCIHDEVVEQAL